MVCLWAANIMMVAGVAGSTMDLILGETGPARIEGRIREATKTATMLTHPVPSLLPDGYRHPLGSQGLVVRTRDSVTGHLQSPRLARPTVAAAMEAITADTRRRRRRPPRTMAPTGITGTNTTAPLRLTMDAIEISGRTEEAEGEAIEVAVGITDRSQAASCTSCFLFCMMDVV